MRRLSTRTFVLVGLAVALVLAGVVSYYASSAPDGLNRVAEDHGITRTEKRHAAENGPMAGYETKGIGNERASKLVAGVTGSLVVLALFGGLTLVLRRRAATDGAEQDPSRSDRETAGR